MAKKRNVRCIRCNHTFKTGKADKIQCGKCRSYKMVEEGQEKQEAKVLLEKPQLDNTIESDEEIIALKKEIRKKELQKELNGLDSVPELNKKINKILEEINWLNENLENATEILLKHLREDHDWEI